jgi:iron uptake system EfeUOB component EfeO/EfeM
MKTAVLPVPLAVLSLLAASCGDDDGEEVKVVVSEFVVEPEQDSADAGEITFVVDNQGADIHEFLVVDADSADEFPVDADGAFDEEAFGAENVLDEVEDIESGTEKELTLDLEPGTYVLLCNVVEEEETGEVESHFAEGMHTTFTVE